MHAAVARSSFGSIEVDQSCHAAEDSGYSYSGSDEAEEDSNSYVKNNANHRYIKI
jgi:hypothetical protein